MNRHSHARCTAHAVALLVSLGLSASALAQQAKIKVLVAEVSNAGAAVDPQLQQMAQDFKRNGLSFTSFKLVDGAAWDLAPGQSGTIKLPTGTATVTVVKREADGKLHIKVVAPAVSTEVVLDRELTLNVGDHAGAKLFLVVRR